MVHIAPKTKNRDSGARINQLEPNLAAARFPHSTLAPTYLISASATRRLLYIYKICNWNRALRYSRGVYRRKGSFSRAAATLEILRGAFHRPIDSTIPMGTILRHSHTYERIVSPGKERLVHNIYEDRACRLIV